MRLNLYLLTQNENCGYDTYDSCVVVAKTEDEARQIHPGHIPWEPILGYSSDWCRSPEFVTVMKIGIASPGIEADSVIIASFNNAG